MANYSCEYKIHNIIVTKLILTQVVIHSLQPLCKCDMSGYQVAILLLKFITWVTGNIIMKMGA